VATAHQAREKRHTFVVGRVSGEALDGELAQVGRGDEARCDVVTVVGRVGRAVLGGSVSIRHHNEPGVFHSVMFFNRDRHENPLAQRGVRVEVGEIDRSH